MRRWTPEEDKFLREHHDRMTALDIAMALGRTEGSVASRASYLGMIRERTDEWTEGQVEYLTRYYHGKSMSQLAAYLHKTPNAVIGKAVRLGLRKRRIERPAMTAFAPVDGDYVRKVPMPTPGPALTCQWIDDEGHRCGVRSLAGRSYCPEHAEIVFVLPQPMKVSGWMR